MFNIIKLTTMKTMNITKNATLNAAMNRMHSEAYKNIRTNIVRHFGEGNAQNFDSFALSTLSTNINADLNKLVAIYF